MGRSELILAKIDNTDQTVLKRGWFFGEFQWPVFSPEGSAFVYQQQRLRPGTPAFDVYLSRFGVKEPKLLTSSGRLVNTGWLSPQQLLVRRSTPPGQDVLHVIDIESGRERLLAENVR